MSANLWFDFDVEELAVVLRALQDGSVDELESVLSAAHDSRPPRAPSSLAGATAGAMMFLSSPSQLWITWSGGGVAVGIGDDALVMVLTESTAAGTACASGAVSAVMDSVELEGLPPEGRALATQGGKVLAGWVWRDDAVVRGLPDQGSRILAEPPRDRAVHTIVADFQNLVTRAAASP